nr:hypothetical protein COLO4_24428 [Ipomoea batatas]
MSGSSSRVTLYVKSKSPPFDIAIVLPINSTLNGERLISDQSFKDTSYRLSGYSGTTSSFLCRPYASMIVPRRADYRRTLTCIARIMAINKTWMEISDRSLPQYEKGVKDFLEFAFRNLDKGKDKMNHVKKMKILALPFKVLIWRMTVLHRPDLDATTVEVSSSNINTMSIKEDETDSDGDAFINDDDEISTTEDEEVYDDD